jgi:predicted RNA-binding Zn-ribbon protein involved in translation (DUF1610 family)
MAEQDSRPCPKCGASATREENDVGVMLRCTECGFQAGDPLKLDFKTD